MFQKRKESIIAIKQQRAQVKPLRRNEQIRTREIRLIDEKGEQKGILTVHEALSLAKSVELDLVEISPTAEPPVCKIMDYSKHVFSERKRLAVAKKKQKKVQLKEIKFRPGTDVGDYNIKIRALIRFLDEGHKAKVTIRFRGREMAHKEQGTELLKRVTGDLNDYGKVGLAPSMEGRQLIALFEPSAKKK